MTAVASLSSGTRALQRYGHSDRGTMEEEVQLTPAELAYRNTREYHQKVIEEYRFKKYTKPAVRAFWGGINRNKCGDESIKGYWNCQDI